MQETRKAAPMLGLVILAAVGLAAGLPRTAHAQNLFSQAADPTAVGSSVSQNDTSAGGSGLYATTYDDFALGAASVITGANWQGQIFNGGTNGNITGFTITLYQNSSTDQPGAVLFKNTTVGNANQAAVAGRTGFYNYSTLFSLPVTVTANTKYWLSIVPDLAFPPQYGWAASAQGDHVSYQDYFGTRSKNVTDLAFGLSGVPLINAVAPEPSSVAAFASVGLFAAGLMLRARRRKRNTPREA